MNGRTKINAKPNGTSSSTVKRNIKLSIGPKNCDCMLVMASVIIEYSVICLRYELIEDDIAVKITIAKRV